MFVRKYVNAAFLCVTLAAGAVLAQHSTSDVPERRSTGTPAAKAAATSVDAQELATLLPKMNTITTKLAEAGYTVAHIEVDRLQMGKIYSATRKLYSGNNYKIVGVGGPGIADLDMDVQDSAAVVVGKDTQDDNVPIVDVTPKASDVFTIRVAAAKLTPTTDKDSENYFFWVIAFKQ
jgi:hypothetical protein